MPTQDECLGVVMNGIANAPVAVISVAHTSCGGLCVGVAGCELIPRDTDDTAALAE